MEVGFLRIRKLGYHYYPHLDDDKPLDWKGYKEILKDYKELKNGTEPYVITIPMPPVRKQEQMCRLLEKHGLKYWYNRPGDIRVYGDYSL